MVFFVEPSPSESSMLISMVPLIRPINRGLKKILQPWKTLISVLRTIYNFKAV